VTRAAECASTLKALRIAMSDNNQNKPPTLGPYVMRTIGRELRAMYAEIIAEGVPERFAEILRKLDEPSNEPETQ
jgi:Anti-sigma factor NepR